MEDERIVALFFERSELAIRALDDKYGALCRAVALEELDECIADKKTFVEGIHIGLCTQTYSLEARSMSFTTAPPLRYPLTRPPLLRQPDHQSVGAVRAMRTYLTDAIP